MKMILLVGAACFLAGLGLGVLIPVLMEPAPRTNATAAAQPATVQEEEDGWSKTEFATRTGETPYAAIPMEDVAPPEMRPPGGLSSNEPPRWMDFGGGERPPPEVRTNREAMMAWMAERRQERMAAARTNLLAKAELSEAEAVRFDVLMTSLNLRLKQQADRWREELESGALSRAEVRARAMNEISSAMVLTYDEMDRNLPAGWRDAAGPDFNLMTFVEPEVWQELRPVMRGGFRGGGPPPSGASQPQTDSTRR